ncbi:Envelope glycoprotein B [Bienertia sinuspersici]
MSPFVGRKGSHREYGSCSVSRATSVETDVLDKNIHEKNNGLEINEARPHDKLPYRGAWL